MDWLSGARMILGIGGEDGGHRKADQASPGDSANGASPGHQGAFGTKIAGAASGAVGFLVAASGASTSVAALSSVDINRQAAAGWINTSPNAWSRTISPRPQRSWHRDASNTGWVSYKPDGTVDYIPDASLNSYQPVYQLTSAQVFVSTIQPDPNFGLPAEGELRVGEITAWRAWRVQQSSHTTLRSVYCTDAWLPGQIMSGDTKTFGIHAWKELQGAVDYISGFGGVVGQVALWGDVIEHEHGYRAEHAKIVSLDLMVRGSETELHSFVVDRPTQLISLAKLREMYLPAKGAS